MPEPGPGSRDGQGCPSPAVGGGGRGQGQGGLHSMEPLPECECQTRQTVHSSCWGGRQARSRGSLPGTTVLRHSSQITLRRKSSTMRGGDTHLWGKRYTIFKETHSQGTVDCKDSRELNRD